MEKAPCQIPGGVCEPFSDTDKKVDLIIQDIKEIKDYIFSDRARITALEEDKLIRRGAEQERARLAKKYGWAASIVGGVLGIGVAITKLVEWAQNLGS